jgi:O-antigen ligase
MEGPGPLRLVGAMKNRLLGPASVWAGALALLLGLAWHGGLHAWILLLAVAAVGLLWSLSARRWNLAPWQLGLFAAVLLWQSLASIQPQISVNQAFWLLSLVLLALNLRLQGRVNLGRGLLSFFCLAVLAAVALFVSAAWLYHQQPGKDWGSTVLVSESIHVFFPNQNLLASALLVPGFFIGLSFIFEKKRGPLAWPGLVILAGAIAFAGSRGALLVLGAAGLWWGSRALRASGVSARLVLCGGLWLLTLGVSWKLPSVGLSRRAAMDASSQTADVYRNQRPKFWRASWAASQLHPWAGWGQGSFAEAIQREDVGADQSSARVPSRYRLHLEHAHNEVLEQAVEWGWPLTVLAIFAVLVWAVFRAFKTEPDPGAWALEAFLAGIAVHAMVDMPLHPPFIQVACALAWAWLDAEAEPVREKPSRPSWPTALALGLALFFSAGAWLALGVKKTEDPSQVAAWQWRAAAFMQPMDASLAAEAWRAGQAQPSPWMDYWGRQNLDWVVARGFQDTHMTAPQALVWEEQCLELRPYDAPRWLAFSRLAESLGQNDLAMQALERALWLEPFYVDAWQWRLSLALEHHDKAWIQASQAAIKQIQALVVPPDQLVDPYVRLLLKR